MINQPSDSFCTLDDENRCGAKGTTYKVVGQESRFKTAETGSDARRSSKTSRSLQIQRTRHSERYHRYKPLPALSGADTDTYVGTHANTADHPLVFAQYPLQYKHVSVKATVF